MMANMIENPRCPRCGGTLLWAKGRVWCSFIGSRTEPPCDYGIDRPVPMVWAGDKFAAPTEPQPFFSTVPPDTGNEWHNQRAIEAVVKAERERCAKIAEQYTCPDPEGSAELISKEICDEIAARIRKGE